MQNSKPIKKDLKAVEAYHLCTGCCNEKAACRSILTLQKCGEVQRGVARTHSLQSHEQIGSIVMFLGCF